MNKNYLFSILALFVVFLILFDSEIALSQKRHYSKHKKADSKKKKYYSKHKRHKKKQERDLVLTSECSENPNEMLRWKINNKNNCEIKVIWQIYGTRQNEIITVSPGETYFFTKKIPGQNKVVIKWKKKDKKRKWRHKSKWFSTLSEVSNLKKCEGDLELEGNTILENKASGTLIGKFTTNDSTKLYSFKLVEGHADNQNFTIVGDKLFSLYAFDYELRDSYLVRVKANNKDNGYGKVLDFTIKVLDNKVLPYNIQLSSTQVEEFSPLGTLIGNISVKDSSLNDAHTFELAEIDEANNNENFEIIGNQLFSQKEFNYREQQEAKIYIKTSDLEGDSLIMSFSIDIINIPDPPINITLSEISFSENELQGKVLSHISSTEKDSLDIHSYSLQNADTLPFIIDNDKLVLNEKISYSNKPYFDFKIIAEDIDGDTLSKNFKLEVINENVAPEDIQLSNLEINELSNVGSFVSKINVIDKNPEDLHEVSLISENEEINDSFFIRNDSLFTNRIFYYHEETNLTLTLIAIDNNGESIIKDLSVFINDVTDAPSTLSLSSNNVDENLPSLTLVGKFSTFDINDRDNFTYKLIKGEGDKDNAAFVIEGNQLLTSGSFNYNTQSTFQIRVSVTDIAGDSFEENFEIEVKNIINPPTDIQLVSVLPVYENAQAPAFLGKIYVEDVDNYETHQLKLIPSTENDDHLYFYIKEDSLFANSSFDFEIKNSYEILIQVTDIDNAVFAKEIQIDITDVNENGSGYFSETRDLLESNSVNVILKDFDNDGDNDALVANQEAPSSLWVNDGFGNFTISNNSFETKPTFDVATEDFDNDGDLDLVFANWNDFNTLWLNDGSGNFIKSPITLGKNYGLSIIAEDIDGDKDKDIIIGSFNGANTIWLNNGNAVFTQSSNSFSSNMTYAILGGDLDNDNDIDIIEIRSGGDQLVWLNNGLGVFTQHPEVISTGLNVFNGLLSDLNNDNNLDLALANPNGGNEIWFNNGDGTFTNSGQFLGEENTYSLAPADLDGDDDLDLVFANRYATVEIWFNNGLGNFENSMQQLNFEDTRKLAAAQIDDDTDIDLFIISNDEYNHIWLNNSKPSGVMLNNNVVPENQGVAYFITNLTALDIDSWDEHKFELEADIKDNNHFFINNDSLFSNSVFDYENKNQYKIEIKTTDKQNAHVNTPVTLFIKDINEQPSFILAESEIVTYGETSIDLLISGINSGDDNYQNMSFSINSQEDSLLVSDAYFSYYSPNEYGYLHFDIKQDVFGKQLFKIILKDNGNTNFGGKNSISKSFTLEIAEPNLNDTNINFCTPDTLKIDPNGFKNFVWYTSLESSLPFHEGETLTFYAEKDTSFYVSAKSSTGIESSSKQKISINKFLKKDIIPVLNNDVLSVSDKYNQYQWFYNNSLISNESNSQLIVAESGEYYVEVINENDCFIRSEKINVEFNLNQIKEVEFEIYPNPVVDYLQLSTDDISLSGAHIQVFDLSGELVYSMESTDENPVLDLSNLKTGFHIIHIIQNDEVYTQRILKN